MPPESVVDQALLLKKRARRRLVGAIALVIVMLIILPNVLKDQSATQDRAPIKLTMPESVENEVVENDVNVQEGVASEANQNQIAEVQPTDQTKPIENADPVISTAELPENITPDIKEAEKPSSAPQRANVNQPEEKKSVTNKVAIEAKVKDKKVIAEQKKSSNESVVKPTEAKSVDAKTQRFLIQIGVYSDEANVKQLQAKISEAGFTSRTAKLQTPKGEKIRLRVGSFVTREAAAEALKKIQASGLTGMVLIDE